MTTDRIEEYLETILYLIKKNDSPAKTKQIAEELDVSPPSVTEMIKKMSDEGLVNYTPYHGVELTEEGAKEAAVIKRKHQVLEKFLADVLDLNIETAHKEACEMEHAVSDIVLERLCNFMGHPEVCPDGNPIDEGQCCLGAQNQYITLCDMHEGGTGTVTMMTLSEEAKERLTSLGLIVGEEVKVKRKQKKGCISILTKGTEIAIGNEIAKKVFLKPKGKVRERIKKHGHD